MLQDKPAGLILRDAADGRRRIERINHVAQSAFITKMETDVGAEMIEICRHCGIRLLQLIIIRESLDAIFDIIRNILLFLAVLLRPLHALYRIIGDGAGGFRLLCSSQRHRLHLSLFPPEQNLRSSHQPHPRLRGIDQGDEETGIHAACLHKKIFEILMSRSQGCRSCQHYLSESSFFQLPMETFKIFGIDIMGRNSLF